MATTTKYLWDDEIDAVAMETDGAGTTQAVYNSDPVPYGRLFSMRRDGETRNYRYDGNGNTRALTNSSGQVTDTYRYSAFGQQRAHTGTTQNPYRYGGQHGYQYNPATGDYDVRARVYQPKRGRWRSKDPLRFVDGSNNYVYVANMPTIAIDRSGSELFLYALTINEARKVEGWFMSDLGVHAKAFRLKCTIGNQHRRGKYYVAVDANDYWKGRNLLASGKDKDGKALSEFETRIYNASLGPDSFTYHQAISGNTVYDFWFASLDLCEVKEMLANLKTLNYSQTSIRKHRQLFGKLLANRTATEYGKYCGPTRRAKCWTPNLPVGPPRAPTPIDGLDRACQKHDCCLANPWAEHPLQSTGEFLEEVSKP